MKRNQIQAELNLKIELKSDRQKKPSYIVLREKILMILFKIK